MREYVSLADYTTFKIGGPARYFVEVHSLDDVRDAISFARQKSLPFFILGGGSNILVSDAGFSGIVLLMKIKEIRWEESGSSMLALTGAGIVWDDFVQECVSRGLWGAENLSGIPGTVGASAAQNIGAYGVEAASLIEWVDVYDSAKEEVRRLSNRECRLGYRNSYFKESDGKNLVIVQVCFRLQKNPSPHLAYKDIKEYIAQAGKSDLSLSEIRSAVLTIRSKKFPDLSTHGTAGSFFKNPIIEDSIASALQRQFPELLVYPYVEGKKKISAAWIIDHVLSLRGVRDKDVGTWHAQSLVLVNFAHATQSDVKEFSEDIQKKFFAHTGVYLEPEVVFIGE